jgi:hypothetical protein
MNRLLRVELLRLRWRRAVIILAAAAILVPVLIGAAVAWNTRPLSSAEQQRIDQQVQQATASDPGTKRRYEKCLANPHRFGADQGDPQAQCAEFFLPQPEWFGGRPALNVAEEVGNSAPGVIIIVTMLALIVGTTFAGHDWNTGSMTNQLLFEARRLRVWTAKALAVLLTSTVVAALGIALFWLVLRVTAGSRHLTVSGATMHLIWTQGLRGVALAAAAGLGGYALTMLFRSTVGTLGILFGLSVIVPILLAVTGIPGFERWLPTNNIGAWILGHVTYTDTSLSTCDLNSGGGCEATITLAKAAWFLAGGLLLASVPSVLSFRRRDVS